MHRFDDLLVLMSPGDGQHLGMGGANGVGFLAHTAGHDDATIFCDRFADGGKALFLGGIEEPACVDQNHVRTRIVGTHRISVGPQTRQDTLRIHQRFRTAERNHADLLLVG